MIRTKNSLVPTKTNISGDLKPSAQALAVKQVVADLTSTNRGNEAITSVQPGKVVGFMPIPKKVTIKVKNTGLVDSLIVPFLNNADFKALPANTELTISDGFAGRLLTRLMNNLDHGNGLMIYGFNITGYDAAGVKSDAVLNALSLEGRYYNGRGDSYVPAEIDLAGAERNTQFKDGLLTVKTLMQLNCVFQFAATLSAGESIQIVLFTQPLQD